MHEVITLVHLIDLNKTSKTIEVRSILAKMLSRRKISQIVHSLSPPWEAHLSHALASFKQSTQRES